jgi:hypothetical protein
MSVILTEVVVLFTLMQIQDSKSPSKHAINVSFNILTYSTVHNHVSSYSTIYIQAQTSSAETASLT